MGEAGLCGVVVRAVPPTTGIRGMFPRVGAFPSWLLKAAHVHTPVKWVGNLAV